MILLHRERNSEEFNNTPIGPRLYKSNHLREKHRCVNQIHCVLVLFYKDWAIHVFLTPY